MIHNFVLKGWCGICEHNSFVTESETVRGILLVATHINVELVGFLQFRSLHLVNVDDSNTCHK